VVRLALQSTAASTIGGGAFAPNDSMPSASARGALLTGSKRVGTRAA